MYVRTLSFSTPPTAFMLLSIRFPHQSLSMQLSQMKLSSVCGSTDPKHLVAMPLDLTILKGPFKVAFVSHYQLPMSCMHYENKMMM